MNLALAKRKPDTEVKVVEIRSMTTADFALLRQNPGPAFAPKTLRDRHHHIAWLCALGKSNLEIAAECRMSPARIVQLKAAPAMQDLIARYRKEIEDSRIQHLREFGAAAAKNMTLSEGILTKELEAIAAGTAQTPSLTTLNRIATDRMDRFGYPKKTLTDSKVLSVHFAANLEAAIARSRKAT